MKKLIKQSALIIALASSGMSASADNPKTSATAVPNISVQLWSVKDALTVDFEGTLEKLAAMGFSGVEFAGVVGDYGSNPAALKEKLDTLGLRVSGAHVSFEQLSPKHIHQTLLFYKTLGTDLITVPYDERAWSDDKVHEVASELSQLAPILAGYGMKIGFHNHDKEFNSFNKTTYWDYLARNTPDNVFLQLDVGWVNYAGQDAIEYVKRYPGRTLTTHYKIRTHKGSNKSPIIGDNGYHWDELIKANMTFGDTRWIVIEQEEFPSGLTSMQSVAKSKAGLDKYLATIR